LILTVSFLKKEEVHTTFFAITISPDLFQNLRLKELPEVSNFLKLEICIISIFYANVERGIRLKKDKMFLFHSKIFRE